MAKKVGNFIEGESSGSDLLIGTSKSDTFALRVGGGDDSISGFNVRTDKVLFDIGGAYSDVLPPFGHLYDGQVFSNWTGTASFEVSAVDANGDGVVDTRIDAFGPGGSHDSITLLGVMPESLASGNFMGG